MMKKIQYILLFIWASNLLYSQEIPYPIKYSWKKENVKGKVQSFTEVVNLAKVKKNGQIVQYSSKTSWAGIDKLIFNKKGNLIKKEIYHYTTKKLYEEKTYQYDKKANLIEFKECYTDNVGTKCHLNKYLYQKQKNKLVVRHYAIRAFFPEANDGAYVYKKWVYTFNSEGNLVKSEKYQGENKLKEEIFYTYNKNGYLIEKHSIYHGYKKEDSKIYYQYNEKGRKIEEKYWCDENSSLKGTEKTITYSYDKNDNIVAEKYGTYQENRIYTIHTYTYKYDKKGNWIQCIEYENNEPLKVFTRTYTYF
ncbi:MAG: hypothetical protein CSA38_01655 [Flavobacteriales bacterium]|nr:MAG: hypothetical protein CSA38_01655 [Flavobacteriales bacterium]